MFGISPLKIQHSPDLLTKFPSLAPLQCPFPLSMFYCWVEQIDCHFSGLVLPTSNLSNVISAVIEHRISGNKFRAHESVAPRRKSALGIAERGTVWLRDLPKFNTGRVTNLTVSRMGQVRPVDNLNIKLKQPKRPVARAVALWSVGRRRRRCRRGFKGQTFLITTTTKRTVVRWSSRVDVMMKMN